MKILFITQHYYPEPFQIHTICEGLTERGHQVTVVTGTPNYPTGNIYAGYEKGKNQDEILHGVTVHRCKITPRKKGVVSRFLNYSSFASASTKYVKGLKEKFDVVFSYQLSPVMQAKAAIAYQKKWGVPFLLYCLDLWPESLAVGKVGKNSPIYRHYKKVAGRIYTQADKLLLSSPSFAKRMQENFGIDIEKTTYLPQHGDDVFSSERCKKIPDGYCDLLFAGNVGLAQSMPTLIQAAAELREQKNIRFHIVGDGTALAQAKDLAEKVKADNVNFYGKQPFEKMPEIYAKADGMIISYAKEEVLSLTLPLKMQSYMAAGKPIICSADGGVAEEIKKANCGYVSAAQDVQGLRENIVRFAQNQDKEEMGRRARAYYEAHFTKEKFLDKLLYAIEQAGVR